MLTSEILQYHPAGPKNITEGERSMMRGTGTRGITGNTTISGEFRINARCAFGHLRDKLSFYPGFTESVAESG